MYVCKFINSDLGWSEDMTCVLFNWFYPMLIHFNVFYSLSVSITSAGHGQNLRIGPPTKLLTFFHTYF